MINKTQEENKKPIVSVIITTKNEEKNIANCIKSILRQSYPCDRIEIIIVDNFSTDKTKKIALSFSLSLSLSLDKEGLGVVESGDILCFSPDKGRLGGIKRKMLKK